MPKLNVRGVNYHYEDTGGQGKDVIVFAHGLLWSGKMFHKQVDALKDKYRVITYDHRGQGQTEVTADGYDMETLYEDAVALIEALGIAPCHFAGLSMGGFIAMRLAARRPDLLKSIILMETSADPEPSENVPRYTLLNFIARWFGLGLVAKPVMKIMFGQTYLNNPDVAQEREKWVREMIGNHRIGITRAVRGVIERKPIYDELDKVTVPTLIMVGDEDVATVPAKSERIHAKIPHSVLKRVPRAGHSASIENAEDVNRYILEFLAGLG